MTFAWVFECSFTAVREEVPKRMPVRLARGSRESGGVQLPFISQVRILPYIRQDVCQLVWSPREAASRRTFGYG